MGEGRSGPRPKRGARVAGVPGLTDQAELAKQIDDLVFTPPVPGIADAMVEFDKAVNVITLGQKDVATTLNAAAGRADKILEANAKKYA